jgi:hypothetical protein
VLGGLYVGPFALLGMLLCVRAYRRGDASIRFLLVTFALIALYFLMSGFGTHFALAYVHFHLALLNRIREAGRYLAVFTMLTALLAGIGVQVIIDVASRKLDLKDGWRRYFWTPTALAPLIFVLALAFDRHEKMTGGWCWRYCHSPGCWCRRPRVTNV